MASESSLHVDNDQSTMQTDLNREAAFNASELEMMWTSTIWNFFYRFSWSYAILPWRFRAGCTFISIGNMINKTVIIVFVASIFESAKNDSAHCLLFLCHSLTLKVQTKVFGSYSDGDWGTLKKRSYQARSRSLILSQIAFVTNKLKFGVRFSNMEVGFGNRHKRLHRQVLSNSNLKTTCSSNFYLFIYFLRLSNNGAAGTFRHQYNIYELKYSSRSDVVQWLYWLFITTQTTTVVRCFPRSTPL